MNIPSIDPALLTPGFDNPVLDSQSVFRTVLTAMSYPGRVQQVATALAAPEPFSTATAAVALTLMDNDTPVFLSPSMTSAAAQTFLRFHAGCAIADNPASCAFAVLDPTDGIDLTRFPVGEDRYPDRSATLIIQVDGFADTGEVTLSGPGIDGSIGLAVQGLPGNFWQQWARNAAIFPVGVDIIFTCGDRLVGLPRSIKAEGQACM